MESETAFCEMMDRVRADLGEAENFYMPVMVVSVERLRAILDRVADLERKIGSKGS